MPHPVHADHRRLMAGLLASASLLLAAPPAAQAANTRYALDTHVVLLVFDGDPTFPSLTSFRNTAGLARFTGSAFGLNESQRNEVVNLIVQRLRERYAAFNVEFVTRPGDAPTPHFTWGSDDSYYVYPNTNVAAEACLGTIPKQRLWGKAIGTQRLEELACDRTPFRHPRHARTFAGSFAMMGQEGVQSEPPLRLGHLLPGNVQITVSHIARALANNATHEIGHLFGLGHTSCTDGACERNAVMYSTAESVEATHDKTFQDLYQDIGNLNRSAGPRVRLTLRNRGLLHDPGSGVMFTQDGGSAAAADTGFLAARSSAGQLDRLGYDDWRLPLATNADALSACSSRLGDTASLRQCDRSDLGRLFYRLLPWERATLVDPAHFNRPYWMVGPGSLPWVARRSTSEQYLTSTAPTAGVWPVRDGARLVDNVDGTVTDTRRGLMWIRDVNVGARRTWVQLAAGLVFAGHSDWRARRLDELNGDVLSDFSCDQPGVHPRTARFDGRRNEMGHLFHGWGINSTTSTPFTGLSAPSPDVDFWFSNPIAGEPSKGLAFSVRTGLISPVLRTAALPVLWVRDFANGVPAGRNVTVDAQPRLTVRFEHVTKAGTLTATSTTRNWQLGGNRIGTPIQWTERSWSSQQNLAYTRGEGQVRICVRYELNELGPMGTIGLWGPTVNGPGRMPLVEGYPDVQNQVVCASAPYLDTVRVQRSLL